MRKTNQIHQFSGIIVVFVCCLASVSVRADWPQLQKLSASDAAQYDFFGISVAISGDYAIVGARYDDDKGFNSGSAYIFKRVGATWTYQDKVVASDGDANDNFGHSVAISGDYAIVGAYCDDNHTGSAYIFERAGASWTQQAKLTASDGAIGDEFGYSVSISGDYAIMGAYYDTDLGTNQCGSAYIFEKPLTGWTNANETTKLFAFEPGPTPGERFGFSVAIDANYAIVGADFSSPSPQLIWSGAAYAFKREGIYWVPLPPKLTASDASAGDWFGSSVAIDANYAIVGATGDDINPNTGQTGCAYVFKRNGPSWIEQDILFASDPCQGDSLGTSTSISGNYAILGTFADSAYIFRRSGTSWIELQQLTASDGAPYDGFGFWVSIDAGQAIAGANIANGNATQSGAAYTFQQVCPAADLNGDCSVYFPDYSIFARNWDRNDCSGPGWCDGADLNQLGQVNWIDLDIFVSLWLDYN